MAEPEPIPTPGVEPTSMESHSPPASPPRNPTWGEKDTKEGEKVTEEWVEPEVKVIPDKVEQAQSDNIPVENGETRRKKIVVVGLGMVGIAFM
jgi:nitrite reductase (NAD(P)H)